MSLTDIREVILSVQEHFKEKGTTFLDSREPKLFKCVSINRHAISDYLGCLFRIDMQTRLTFLLDDSAFVEILADLDTLLDTSGMNKYRVMPYTNGYIDVLFHMEKLKDRFNIIDCDGTFIFTKKSLNPIPKRHLASGTKCLICEDPPCIVLHKTKRQTHSLCEDCMIGYITPKVNDLIEQIRSKPDGSFLTTCRPVFKCPGNVNGEHRNMCEHEIDISEFYQRLYEGGTVYFKVCNNVPCTKIYMKNGICKNVPGKKVCRMLHHYLENIYQYGRRVGVEVSTPSLVKKLGLNLPEKLSNDLSRISAVMKNRDICLCFNRDCSSMLSIEGSIQRIDCYNCETSWCRKCAVSPYHEGRSCEEFKIEMESTDDGQYFKRMEEAGLLRKCPGCSVYQSKIEGCNKMSCSQCGIFWCWLCGEKVTGYEHFNTRNTNKCAGKLWKGTEHYHN